MCISRIIPVERIEIKRTDFKSSFVGIAHAPGSPNDVARNEIMKRTKESRNTPCKDG